MASMGFHFICRKVRKLSSMMIYFMCAPMLLYIPMLNIYLSQHSILHHQTEEILHNKSNITEQPLSAVTAQVSTIFCCLYSTVKLRSLATCSRCRLILTTLWLYHIFRVVGEHFIIAIHLKSWVLLQSSFKWRKKTKTIKWQHWNNITLKRILLSLISIST